MIAKNVSYYDSSAYENAEVVKASPGTVHRISGYSSNVAAQFIQLHDAASLPANGVAPAIVFTVPASSNFDYDLSEIGRYCKTGIVVCNSTAGPTKTLGAADVWFNIQFT